VCCCLSHPDATIHGSMSSAPTSGDAAHKPRVGIPWRTTAEERAQIREKLDHYFDAVRKAGAEPQEIRLEQPREELERQIESLDGFVLPGSPADVDPSRYGAPRHIKTKALDANRDATDEAVLQHALLAHKPVLAICYGCQILNVHLKGTLVQDIPAEKPGALRHGNTDLPAGVAKGDAVHSATFAPNSRLASLNEGTAGEINSSHHQAIDRPGESLRVTAKAPDGTIEGVEWTGDSNWVVGVQWHPERMPDDPLAERLFADFVAAARSARNVVTQKS
jgi:putative glutamine amidotransferase